MLRVDSRWVDHLVSLFFWYVILMLLAKCVSHTHTDNPNDEILVSHAPTHTHTHAYSRAHRYS
jgi:hypothetical protein